jgi:SAM-dependent methyltransferase
MDNGVPLARASPRAVDSPVDSHGRSLDVLVGSTIFLSAFLLFQVQPIIGKAILPRFGGSAAVWTACLLFFQGMLLAGYLYAHACVTFLAPAWQRRVHIVLLLAGVAALPITPGPASPVLAQDDPSSAILVTLAASVGLPYFLLAATSPLLQAWITQLRPGAVPYRLFALSNFASLLALFTYPVAVEPFVPLRLQSWAWSAAFVTFALLCGTLAWRGVGGSASHLGRDRPASPAPAVATCVSWVLLAACPSILLLAITNHLTQNIAPIPFLWIVPLVLYLLSFILCFERRSLYRRALFLPLAAVALVGMDVLLADVRAGPDLTVRLLAPLFALGLFVCCMACHGELARSKPAPDRLTAFYLAVSAGGVLGGMLVAVVAPRVFDDFHELPLAFVLTAACLGWAIWRDRAAAATGGARLALGFAVAIVPMFLALRVGERLAEKADPTEVAARNFYGTLRVIEMGEGAFAYRSLFDGRVEHGGQFASAGLRRWPTAYYAPQSGVGRALLAGQMNPAQKVAQKVGVIGLGTGTLAAYSRPGDTYVFYEINPLVASIALSKFSYLADAMGTTTLVMGDARVSLEQQAAQGFDLLVVDAFSGDSVPIHLLTAEAFSIYFRHLKPSGVLAVHTTSGYLELNPVVKTAASHFGKESVLVKNGRAQRQAAAASWILVAAPGNDLLRKLREDADPDYPRLPPVRLWTDDYSSVLTVVRAWGKR